MTTHALTQNTINQFLAARKKAATQNCHRRSALHFSSSSPVDFNQFHTSWTF
ncbi:MAG: ECF transporter S component [Lactobacillus helveticus]